MISSVNEVNQSMNTKAGNFKLTQRVKLSSKGDKIITFNSLG